MKYEEFEAAIERAGLTAKRCSEHHWQIRGGPGAEIVDCWPNSKRGFRYRVGQATAQSGTLADAIRAADPYRDCAPWEGPSVLHVPPRLESYVKDGQVSKIVVAADPVKRNRVGLIRWLWRLIW